MTDLYYLTRPQKKDVPALQLFKQEFTTSHQTLQGGARLDTMDNLEEWLTHITNQEKTPKENRVASSTLIFKQHGTSKIIGIVNIRHSIDQDHLKQYVGHIGYSIAPSEQGQGLAKIQLAKALEFCKYLELNKILITCADWNTASRHVIMLQPAIYEDSRLSPSGDLMERYWITLSNKIS